MALTKVDSRLVRPNVIWKSPYDYGAVPGEELTADNKVYIDALMDAAKASWDATYKTFTIMPTGLGKMWNCPGGTRMNGVRQKGMVIRDFQLYLSGSGAIGFDIAGSAWVTFENCHVEGDFTSEPAVGFLYGLDSTLDIASRISLFNCSTLGGFAKAGRVNLMSETSLEVGCRWWNGSRILTAPASIGVDHMGAIDDHVGGLTSPNTTLPTAADGHKSFVLHDWGTTQHIRYSRVNLTVTGITKANPAVVTVTTGTLASSGLANGDKIVFYPINGMTELRYTVFTVANISGDTFELSGVNSTGYGTFTSGVVRNQTGPAMLLAGIQQLHNGPAYTITYGAPHIVMDIAQTTGGNPSNTASELHLAMQCEVDPINIMEVHQGTTAKTLQGWNLELLGAAHPVGDAVYNFVDSADVLFHKGGTRITRMSSAPTNGLFKDTGTPSTSKISLWFHDISVPLAAALNDPDDFALYRVRELAFDRSPDRLRDYEQPRFYGVPEFIQEAIGNIAVRVRLADDGALSGPFVDLIRDSASPAVSDVLARMRWIGKDSGGNETEYGGISSTIIDPTDGSEDGLMTLWVPVNGTLTNVVTVQNSGLFSRGHLVQTMQTATTAALDEVTDAINVTRKFAGKMVWNTDTNKPCWATNSTAVSVWVNADGTTAHTPV